jgi:hypothetical protein
MGCVHSQVFFLFFPLFFSLAVCLFDFGVCRAGSVGAWGRRALCLFDFSSLVIAREFYSVITCLLSRNVMASSAVCFLPGLAWRGFALCHGYGRRTRMGLFTSVQGPAKLRLACHQHPPQVMQCLPGCSNLHAFYAPRSRYARQDLAFERRPVYTSNRPTNRLSRRQAHGERPARPGRDQQNQQYLDKARSRPKFYPNGSALPRASRECTAPLLQHCIFAQHCMLAPTLLHLVATLSSLAAPRQPNA